MSKPKHSIDLSIVPVEEMVTEIFSRPGIISIVAYCDVKAEMTKNNTLWMLGSSGSLPIRRALSEMIDAQLDQELEQEVNRNGL